MITLFDNADSGNGYKIRLLFALLGVAHERVEIDTSAGESRTPEYLARNANGRSHSFNWKTDRISPSPVRFCTTSPSIPLTGPPRGAINQTPCTGCSSSSTATNPT